MFAFFGSPCAQLELVEVSGIEPPYHTWIEKRLRDLSACEAATLI